MLAVQLCCARHCELPLSKMGNKGLFPGVAVPLAFFCTLFFRHRKKSVSAPWDGKSLSAPESARQSPPKGIFLRQGCQLLLQAGGFPLAPCTPSVSTTETNRQVNGDGKAHSRAVVGASIPPEWVPFRQSWRTPTQAGGFPLVPCTPLGRLPKQIN